MFNFTKYQFEEVRKDPRTTFCDQYIFIKVALGVCFALKSWKEYLLFFTYLITSSKDVTLLLITKF